MKSFGDLYKDKKKSYKKTKPSKEQLIDQAIQFHLRGNIQEATKLYQLSINEGCNDPRVFSNYGAIWKDLGKLQEAEKYTRKAIKINPNFTDGYFNLGVILKDLGKLKDAELSFCKAIELNPNYAESHSNLGNILTELGKLKDAEISYRKAIAINPDFTEAHFNLGVILKELSNIKDAEISLRKTIELNPNFTNAHLYLGKILIDLGKLKDAELSTLKAIEINPNLADAHLNLGKILRDLGESQKAELSYRKAIEINPDFAKAHYNLGNILRDQENTEKAELSYRKAIEINPDFPEAHSNLGNILKDQGESKKAELSYRKAIEINPDFAEAHFNLGVLLKELSNNKDAEISLRKTIELNPNNAEAHLTLGETLKELGNLKDAEISLRESIELKPYYARAYFILSLFITPKAKDNFLKVLFSEEILKSQDNIEKLNQADIFFARGNILNRKKDFKESWKMFKVANLITRKKFKSNFKIFKEALENDNLSTKNVGSVSSIKNKIKDLPIPIFTVGLPRAGKSTIEAVLSKNNFVKKFGDRKGISVVMRDYKNIEISFKRLGISIDSTYKDIRTAYLKLANKYHPDKGGDEDLMAQITEGYNFLRSEYKNKPENYKRPNLYEFFLQKLDENLNSFRYTCHTSPNNILYTGLIASQMPQAKIIYCYRNPKDHIIELYKYNLQNYLPLKTSIIDLAKIIVIIDKQMEEYRNKLHSKIYFLNFDQLIIEPEREIQLILKWLGWRYDKKYLTPELTPKGSIQSKKDFNNFNSSYLNESINYMEMLKPVEVILSKILKK